MWYLIKLGQKKMKFFFVQKNLKHNFLKMFNKIFSLKKIQKNFLKILKKIVSKKFPKNCFLKIFLQNFLKIF